jgi:hypothetical protein
MRACLGLPAIIRRRYLFRCKKAIEIPKGIISLEISLIGYSKRYHIYFTSILDALWSDCGHGWLLFFMSWQSVTRITMPAGSSMSPAGTRPANRRASSRCYCASQASPTVPCQPLSFGRHLHGRDHDAIAYRGCFGSPDLSLFSFVLKLPSSSHDGRTAPPFSVRPFLILGRRNAYNHQQQRWPTRRDQ